MLKAEQDHLAFLHYKVFEENPTGKELLEKYVEGLLLTHHSQDGPEKDLEFRNGQSALVRNFIAYVKLHKHNMKQNAKKMEGGE